MSERTHDRYGDYAETHADPRFTDWLRERAEPGWTEATTHRFVREVGEGTVEDSVFRRYLLQDYAFVEALVGTFGHAVGEAPTMAAKARLVSFLGVLTDDEDDYFERAFDAVNVSESASTDPNTTATTRAFDDLLYRVRSEGGYAETLAVLTAAEWVLAWASAIEGRPSQFYLAEWIDLHDNDGFRSFVAWLRDELDREGVAASPHRRRRIDWLFRRTVELEVAFFESAYDPDGARLGGEA